MRQSNLQQYATRSNVFDKSDFHGVQGTSQIQNGVLQQSSFIQTPHGVRQITTHEYPKDSTVIKLITSTAPGSVTQVSPSRFQLSRAQNQLTPPRNSTIIRKTESPLRYVSEQVSPNRTVMFNNQQIPVQSIVREQVPVYIIEQPRQQVTVREIEKPVYIEKIVEVQGDDAEENRQLREQNQRLEEEIKILRSQSQKIYSNSQHVNQQQIQSPQIQYQHTQFSQVDNEKVVELQKEIDRLRSIIDDDNERIKNQKRNQENDWMKHQNDSLTQINQVRQDYENHIKELVSQNEQLQNIINLKQTEFNNLSIQINQLKGNENRQSEYKSRDYADKINILTSEIERLTANMKQSHEQYDSEIFRLQDLLNQRQRELEDLRLKVQRFPEYDQRILQLQAEVERLRANQGDPLRISQLEGKIRDLEAQLLSKDKQLNELRQKAIELEQVLLKYKQYEAKLMECETVNLQLRKKIEELSLANRRISDVEVLLREKGQLEDRVNQLNAQVDLWQRKYSQIEQELQITQRKFEQTENELRSSQSKEGKIHDLLDQVTKLNNLVSQKDQEIQRLKGEVNQYNIRLTQVNVNQDEIKRLNDSLLHKQREIDELNRRLIDSEQNFRKASSYQQKSQQQTDEINSLKIRIEELTYHINEEGVKRNKKNNDIDAIQREKNLLQDKVNNQTSQIESLSLTIRNLEQELGGLKRRASESDTLSISIRQFEQRAAQLEQQNTRLSDLLRQRDDEVNSYKQQISTLTINVQQFGASREELQKIQSLLNAKSNELDETKRKIVLLEQRLSGASQFELKLQECEINNAQLRKKIEEQLQDFNRKQVRIQELENALRDRSSEEKLVISAQTISHLQLKLQQYEQELNIARQRSAEHENAGRTIQDLESRLRKLSETNEYLNSVISQKDKELSLFKSEINTLSIRITQAGASVEELNQRIREIEELKKLITNLESQLHASRSFEGKVQDLEQANYSLRQQLQSLSSEIHEEKTKKSRQNNDYENALKQKNALEEQVVKLSTQLEFIQRLNQQQEQELGNLRNRVAQLEKANSSISISEQKVITLQQQVERLTQIVQDKDNESNRLRSEVNSLQINIRQVGASQEEVNRLNQQLSLFQRQLAEKDQLIQGLKLYEGKLQECERNNAELRILVEQLRSQINDEGVKRTRFEQAAREKAGLEERLNSVSIQFEQTSKRLQSQDQELNALRLRNQELENVSRLTSQYEPKINQMSEQINRLNQIVSQRENEANQLRLELQQAQLLVKQLSQSQGEVARLNELLNLRSREAESYKQKISETTILIQNSHQNDSKIKDLESQNLLLKRKVDELILQIQEINADSVKKSQKLSQIDILLREKQQLEERLRRLSGLEQDVASLRGQLSESQSSNQKLVYENTKLSEQLQQLAKDADVLRNRNQLLEQQIIQFKQFEVRSQQQDRIILELKQRVEELMVQVKELNDDRIRRQNQVIDLENRLRATAQLEERLHQYQQQNEALILRNKQYEVEISRLMELLSIVKRSIEEWQIVQAKLNGYGQIQESIRNTLNQIQITTSTTQNVIHYKK